MRRALALATAQRGRTGANPAVGCVLVRDGVVVGEGATADGGTPHAEERALVGVDARDAIAYVTLEPCSQRSAGGKSCAQLLIEAGVREIVIATRDPHPQGRGLELLEAAGVRVSVGFCEDEARAINADFIAKWGSSSS